MYISRSRRGFLAATAAVTTGLLSGAADALTVKPRQRVIIDNDFSGDPDGLFQLAHHLASPSVEIAFVIGSHIHDKDFLDASTNQADNAAMRVHDIFSRMNLVRTPAVVSGRNAAMPKDAKPEMTPATRMIIAEAMRNDTKLPLFYAAGAGLTDLAEALRLEPQIAKRMKLIWIGGMEHDDLTPGVPERDNPEYNLTIDLTAARTVFNDSDIEIWQVPRNVYRQLNIAHTELIIGLRPAGELGRYLLAQLERVIASTSNGLGETYILGDSPLVTLTALQSSFDADSSSSAYVVQQTPRISEDGRRYEAAPDGRAMRIYTSIDTRLTFADMFAKMAVSSVVL